MFDIRKVQEKVMYEAVRAKSNADVAGEVVYGCEKAAHTENNSDCRIPLHQPHLHCFLL